MNTGTLISSTTLTRELLAFDIHLDKIELFAGGMDYFCPNSKWLIEFGKFIGFSRDKYTADVYVCEQFARYAAACADNAAHEAGVKNHHSFGEARGMLRVESNNPIEAAGTGHALNMVRCDDGQWWVFDPQCCEDETTILPYTDSRNMFVCHRWRG